MTDENTQADQPEELSEELEEEQEEKPVEIDEMKLNQLMEGVPLLRNTSSIVKSVANAEKLACVPAFTTAETVTSWVPSCVPMVHVDDAVPCTSVFTTAVLKEPPPSTTLKSKSTFPTGLPSASMVRTTRSCGRVSPMSEDCPSPDTMVTSI